MFTANHIYIFFQGLLLMVNFIYTFKLYTFKFFRNQIFKMNLTQTLKFLRERNLTVFTPKFHILVLHPNLTQIQSSSNNLDHICHLVSPYSLPTLFFDAPALCINPVYQRIVTGSTGSFVAVGTGNLVAGSAVHLVAAGSFGPGALEILL